MIVSPWERTLLWLALACNHVAVKSPISKDGRVCAIILQLRTIPRPTAVRGEDVIFSTLRLAFCSLQIATLGKRSLATLHHVSIESLFT